MTKQGVRCRANLAARPTATWQM